MKHTFFIPLFIIFISCVKKKDFQKAPNIVLDTVINYPIQLTTFDIFSADEYKYRSQCDSVFLRLITTSQTNLNQISVYGHNCTFDYRKNGFEESNLGELQKRTGFSTPKTDTLEFMLIPQEKNFTFSIQSFNDHNLYNTKNINFSVVN